MEFKLTIWRKFSGGVAHGMNGDKPMISLIFSEQVSYDLFSGFFAKLNTDKLKITFIEFQREYSIVIYEDPGTDFFPEIGFYTDGMNIGGFYKQNRELLMDNEVYFTYTFQEMGTPHSSQVMEIKPHVEPIKINQCQIISESDISFKTISELKNGVSADVPFLVESAAYCALKNT